MLEQPRAERPGQDSFTGSQRAGQVRSSETARWLGSGDVPSSLSVLCFGGVCAPGEHGDGHDRECREPEWEWCPDLQAQYGDCEDDEHADSVGVSSISQAGAEPPPQKHQPGAGRLPSAGSSALLGRDLHRSIEVYVPSRAVRPHSSVPRPRGSQAVHAPRLGRCLNCRWPPFSDRQPPPVCLEQTNYLPHLHVDRISGPAVDMPEAWP